VAALQEAHTKAETASGDAMSKLTGGMKIPGLF
jgi:DNA-binding protein YbaB